MSKSLKVTWIRSTIGHNKNQGKIITALGFKKLNQTRILPDNESIRGSLFHVRHLVRVEERISSDLKLYFKGL